LIGGFFCCYYVRTSLNRTRHIHWLYTFFWKTDLRAWFERTGSTFRWREIQTWLPSFWLN
jgi:hypothetical protein